jgi:CBS domain-containing protein
MPNYGRDFGGYDQDRAFRGGGARGGRGGGYGGMGSDGFGTGYGGMGADAGPGGQGREGYTGFGTGGGAYDQDFSSGMGGGRGQFGGRGYGGGLDPDRVRFVRYGGDYGAQGRGGYGAQGGGMGRGMGGGTYGGGGRFGGQQDFMGDRGGYGQQQGGGDELRRMRAADIMTENPETVTPEASLADAARKMRDLNVGIIPVVESDQNRRLRGVITDRDIAIRAVAEGKDASSTRVSEVMTSDVETCNKNDSVQDVLQLMEREQVRRVPITDREGRLVGIVAQADVATDLDSDAGSRRVADTLERISEPGRPGMTRGTQARGGGTTSGGGLSASPGGAGMTGARTTGGMGTQGGTGAFGGTGEDSDNG